MKIYWIKTQAPRRVLALVKYLGIDADCIEVDVKRGDLRTPEYAALNPNCKAPTMVDGDVVIWESSAINAYLCIKHGSDMWPAHNPAEQVEVIRWLSWNDNHWARAVGPFYFEHVIKPMFQLGDPNREALAATAPELKKLAAVLDGQLKGRDFVACGRLTIADFQLAAMACDWRRSEMPLEDFPNVVRWLDGLMRIPAWADPWPVTKQEQRATALAG
ncbi:glutathione S-transferase family protein [Dyella solisilvae]|uniref:Glutathione S-transferase family protein n=1 Tax=Dyella solisilvae TaxID=1920168 RepID=A0A370KD40_9GAMM|nr:glutathione S-transferase family protein [Dyella solisilvae]RDJ00577.1 glutathione S-transferase family protein [Dyella solisilvae]